MKKISLLYFAAGHPDYTRIGKVPSVVFYGTDRLRENPDFTFHVCWKRNTILRLLWKPFEQYVIHRVHVGFRLDQALLHLPLLRRQDVIYAETDSCGLPLLFLKRMGLIKARIGFNSAGLINNLAQQDQTRLFAFYKWLLTSADFIVCWSPLEEKMYKDRIGAKAQVVFLEADTDFYQPDFSTSMEDFILCVGNDLGRDFKTLFQAVETLGIRVKLVTKAARIKGLSVPKNVELHLEYVDFPTLLDWYRRARLVVINLQEIHRFTGQRALLESLAMGKATIVAKTQALTSTYALVDGQEVLFYEPGNAQDLAAKILNLCNDQAKLRELGETARQYTERLPKDSFYFGLRALCVETFEG